VTTSSSLSLRALLKEAIARSGMDAPVQSLSGLTSPAKALFVAGAAHAMPRGVVLFIVPSDRDLEQAVQDVGFFVAALEGLSDVAADRAVLAYPSHEIDPYRGMAPHAGVTSARARALHALATGTARVVVASAAALLPRVSAPSRLLNASIDLRPGQDIAPTDLGELLVDAGFRREDPADEHGEFAVRGGILDVFPANETEPVRLEFVGDTIETLRTYDPATQRSVRAIDQLTVIPLSDVLGDDRSGTLFDYLARSRESRVVVSEPEESHAALDRLVEQVRRSYDAVTSGTPDAPAEDWIDEGWDDDETGEDETPRSRKTAAAVRTTTGGRKVLTAPPPRAADDDVRSPRPIPPASRARAPRVQLADVRPPSELFVALDTIDARLRSATTLVELGVDDVAAQPGHAGHVRCQPSVEFRGRVPDWVGEVKRLRQEGETSLFVAGTSGRAERTIEVLKEYDVFAAPVERADDARYAAVLVATGALSRGFRLPDAGLQIYAEPDVFEEERRQERRRSASKAFLSDLRDLKVGDLVVHVDHGIGVFVGLKQIGVGPSTSAGPGEVQEFLELRYAGEDKLFVPVERLDLVQKYTGASRPPIDRLGGTTWERAKTRVKKAMRDMAEELLKLYAARKAVPGHAFSPDSHWQQEFEDAFPYELTVDQRSAIEDIKRDLESPTPMDRLLCGDVGYGKTEVAMRAAFKVVMDGKQVAFLAPTTILAFQHEKTLRERFAGFPVTIDMVSRFRTKEEQKETLARLAEGKLDIIVGTHRLLSKDVQFHDLGLLVVDEEQRFGVAHKEKIKQLRRKVDVLTMSATPIPRTLNMSLVGIRDMSVIETPPRDRLAIQTNVVKFDQQVIARAIRHELERGGQVYFVHNRVESIYAIGDLIRRLVPEARIVVGHGQMDEEQLERAMLDFVARKFDILLATTIVENGLDIPNANTIIINRADRYGLSQLYQLRGRVGRSDRHAYAYLLIPPEDTLSPVAKKRLAAMKEFSDLGSGFRVAALDLEIRGAGNLLGGEQSGQIETVGFEMYMKLLEETVRELKGEEIEDDTRANVNLRVDLRIDESYIPDMNQRLMLYRKIASARRDEEIDATLEEAADRYGPLPTSVLNLADYGRIRVMADQLGVDSIDREGRVVVLKFGGRARVDPTRMVNLVRQRGDLTIIPPSGLRLALDGLAKGSGSGERGPGTADRRPGSDMPAGRSGLRPPAPGTRPQASDPRKRRPEIAPSWWTARAREGEVKPGFTKAEILKAQPDDPRAPGGVFERVGGLLTELLS
jgi:transcription-repair coupling factor (superfamily II helicase)